MKPNTSNSELVILVDGSSFLFRAYHALPPLTNSKGQATGVIYGVVNMLHKLCKDYATQHVILVFDAPGKTFREEIYPAYKEHREATPKDLQSQFKPLMEFLKHMGFPIVIIDGVEADDVIGTMCRQALEHNKQVLIATGDKDLAQLVSENVTLINTMSQTILTPKTVFEKFGVQPKQFIDYLTLVGDSSDNIPGVKMCGPKTAAKWLNEFQSVEKLLQNIHKIKGKIATNLQDFLPQLPLTQQLVTIKTDVKLPKHINDLKLLSPDTEKLINLCEELEFKTWLIAIKSGTWFHGKKTNQVSSPDKSNKKIIDDNHKLITLIQKIANVSLLALSIIEKDGEITAISIATDSEHNFYLEFDNKFSLQHALASLKIVFENKKINKLGHNLKIDYQILKKHNVQLSAIKYDTMLETYLLASGTQKPQARESDAAVIFKNHLELFTKLPIPHQKILVEIEIPLLIVIAEMEYHGVLIDPIGLKKQQRILSKRIDELTQDAYKLAGAEFNINSPKQLQQILFEKLKLPHAAKTPSGQISTAESVLQELALEYELPKIILEYRGLTKLVSTYLEGLPKRMNSVTHRVHTNYQQAITATGRLSSTDPNLQNIPIRSEEGRKIRQCFVAPPHHLILAADYSQIELRIMAHISQDENLLKAFKHADDVHRATAANLFHVDLAEVTPEQRRKAKAVNFGLIYGMSAFGLSKQIDVSRHEAQQIIDQYFHQFPKVLDYMQNIRKLAHEQGYVTTLHGRQLRLTDINSQNMQARRAAERMAINAPMQGTAAEIIKSAMIALYNWIKKNPGKAYMIMQVHDELVFEVHKDHLIECQNIIKQTMEHVVKMSVPLIINIGIGNNWDEAHA
jgi:DNA polymerase-1